MGRIWKATKKIVSLETLVTLILGLAYVLLAVVLMWGMRIWVGILSK